MIRSFYSILAILCVTAVVATAQAPAGDKPADTSPTAAQPTAQQPPAQQPTTPKPSTSAKEPAAGKVTYTGCVKPGTTAGTWILENAEIAAKPGAAPGAVGTSGASKTTLSLEPAASVNLTPHANHKVEVSGMLEKPSASSPSASGATAKQEFSVESLKMVSATCP
jgi:hypothetical protein